jgi:hypothetical protein
LELLRKRRPRHKKTNKDGSLTVTLAERGRDWEMSFADTGAGIDRQQTEKIFEPFQSNFEGGTGLGLAIVYQIVQAHEGKVWARSELGKGSSFVVRLRRMEDAHEHDRVAAIGVSSASSSEEAELAATASGVAGPGIRTAASATGGTSRG